MANQSFRADFNNPHQNAVVSGDWIGDRGYAYREGFMQATLALLAAAAVESYIDPNTENTETVFVDVLVYPICFNARHFVELFLKDSIRTISNFGTSTTHVDVIKTHSLTELWTKFAETIARDKRLVELGMPLKEFFNDFAEVDNDSMAFRYSHDLDENLHLTGVEHINLGTLGDRLRNMFKQAEEFSLYVTELQQEYAQSTFTGKLNRANIGSIARRLPKYGKWAEELALIKKEICDELELSSNDFGKALSIIKNHREFSSLIGLELPLAELPTDVFKRLAKVHNGEATYDLLKKSEWLSLEAVMEVSRLASYSEEYDPYLNYISSPDYKGSFDPAHIARNAFARNQRLRGGLIKLGQRTLLAELAQAIPHLAEPMKQWAKLSAEELSSRMNNIFSHLKPMHSKNKSIESQKLE